MKTPNIIQYYDQLDSFDWMYEHSDSYDVWVIRSEQYINLFNYSSLSETHRRLYEDFRAYHFHGADKPCLNDYLITMGGLGIDYYEEEDCK